MRRTSMMLGALLVAGLTSSVFAIDIKDSADFGRPLTLDLGASELTDVITFKLKRDSILPVTLDDHGGMLGLVAMSHYPSDDAFKALDGGSDLDHDDFVLILRYLGLPHERQLRLLDVAMIDDITMPAPSTDALPAAKAKGAWEDLLQHGRHALQGGTAPGVAFGSV